MARIQKIHFPKTADVPKSALPVLILRGVLSLHATGNAAIFRKRFKENGWTGLWTDTIYDYTHFHSNRHEVLGIAAGKVALRIGGEAGSLFRLKAGDMIL